MDKLRPYVSFDGQAVETMRFYAQAVDGKVEMTLAFGESPMAEEVPAQHRKRVMHSTLRLPDGGQLFADDKLPGVPGSDPNSSNGIGLMLQYEAVAAGKAAFHTLAAGGSVLMPMAPNFWVEQFWTLTDRYGVRWMINAGLVKT